VSGRAAHEGDPVCTHRALLAYPLGYKLGSLDSPPEPEPPVAATVPANFVPFPMRAEREQLTAAATAERVIAYVEQMAARYGDEPVDFGIAA
jgi:hypothetical protein